MIKGSNNTTTQKYRSDNNVIGSASKIPILATVKPADQSSKNMAGAVRTSSALLKIVSGKL